MILDFPARQLRSAYNPAWGGNALFVSPAKRGRRVKAAREGAYLGRLLVVVHRDEDEDIRIISARKATRRETKDYEEGI